jgi:Flp pilus assembly protein TadG
VNHEPEIRTNARVADRNDERGIAALWMAITIFLMLAVAAIAVDLVNGLLQAQRAQNAADAASLSGVVYLPDADAAASNALDIARQNGFTNTGNTHISVTRTADYDLKVEVKRTFNTFFARAIGFDSLTVRKSAVATYEPPQAQAAPLDLVVLLDRTSSMVTAPHVDAFNKLKVAANALFDSLDATRVHVALGLTGPSTTTTCGGGGYGTATTNVGSGLWMVAPNPQALPVSDYHDLNSQIRRTITCMNTSNVGTNLGDPIARAVTYMQAWHTPGADQAILLMTDGEANEPNNTSCTYANQNATVAKAAGIKLVTIGFGIEGNTCTSGAGENGAYMNQRVTQLLADMASPSDSGAPSDDDLACTSAGSDPIPENQDDDNFYCVPKDQDLSEIFVQAVSTLTAKREPRLIG